MDNTTHFFLGANSGQGFQSLFQSFCVPENHRDLLVLKGGPGSGKSTMMRKIGAAMEGHGEQVEYLHCSGDPTSLDGVWIPRIQTAVVDGTSPHIIEPRYPAAIDRYVNLGQFYNIDAAKDAREEIVSKSDACRDAYQRAYQVFGAVRNLEESIRVLLSEGMDYDKLQRRTDGIITREIRGKGSGEKDRHRFLGSVTCEGMVWRFDSVEKLCPKIYLLYDSAGFSAPMLEHIHRAARIRGYSSILCPDAEHMNQLQHVLLPELGVAFLTTREGMVCSCAPYRKIHLDAMVSTVHRKRWKGRIKFLQKIICSLREEGISYLQEAKTAHDALEAVYQPNVDFVGIDALTAQEIRRMEGYL